MSRYMDSAKVQHNGYEIVTTMVINSAQLEKALNYDNGAQWPSLSTQTFKTGWIVDDLGQDLEVWEFANIKII